jgi:hypothetical protein
MVCSVRGSKCLCNIVLRCYNLREVTADLKVFCGNTTHSTGTAIRNVQTLFAGCFKGLQLTQYTAYITLFFNCSFSMPHAMIHC